MYVDYEVINAAARLIQGTLDDGLPVEDEVEHAGLDKSDAQALQDILDELNWADLVTALRAAADRLPEPAPDDDEDDE